MPVHDWTRVDAGVFHDFHTAWLIEIRNALNGGLLPAGFYALAEQSAGVIGPDVLTLERRLHGGSQQGTNGAHSKSVLAAPPKVKFVFQHARRHYLKKQRRLAIRHRSKDRLVAIVEIVSQGNKSSTSELRTFVDKAAGILLSGINLMVIDLYPPNRRASHGIHAAIWRALGERTPPTSHIKPSTLVSYNAADQITAYVEPIGVGERLKDMPLFLEDGRYIGLPLEATYTRAWRGVPRHLQEELARPS